jgi:gamma-glutamyl-gamma-aminobutyrate hydrolase PuuD
MRKKDTNKAVNKPRIAVTYSESVGGQSVKSVMATLAELRADVVNADYREIMPVAEDLDGIYEDENLRNKKFQEAKMNATEFLKDKDCLVLSGNSKMVDPRLYGQNLDGANIDLARAIAEMALVHVAMQRGMPILGICGGHQILNVYLGGDLEDLDADSLKAQSLMDYSNVRVDKDSELAGMLLGKPNSDGEVVKRLFGAHTQVVKKMGGKGLILDGKKDYLKTVALANDPSKNIEATESNFGSPVLGVQFHPEVGAKGLPLGKMAYQAEKEKDVVSNKNLFKSLLQSAETFRNKKRVLAELVVDQKPRLKHVEKTKEMLEVSVAGDSAKENPHNSKKPIKPKKQRVSFLKSIANSFLFVLKSIAGFFIRKPVSAKLINDQKQAASSKQQAASSKQQAASSKQQAASSKLLIKFL